MIDERRLTTEEKALKVNLTADIYGCFAEIGAAHRPGQAVHGRVHAECARPHRRREVLPTHRRHAAALHLYLNSGRAALHLRLLLPVYLLVRDRAEIKQ